jgi:coiled-coil domain-containing protein 130
MGERKGQNHYYPPDFNYKKHKSLNSYHGTHALRERAKKIKEGILVIRFEMPFNVWCETCKNHIGMGVRYNAEKKKCGMYYTTPIYEFRMKCHLCDGYYVIRTDPKNFTYELVEGCRRQENRFDPADVDNFTGVDRVLSQKLAGDAMMKAEHVKDDKAKADKEELQIEKLTKIQSRLKDAHGINSLLRKQFRTEKKILNQERAADSELAKRLSLNFQLEPSKVEDSLVAKRMLRLKDVQPATDKQREIMTRIQDEPIFKTGKQVDPDSKIGQLKIKAQQNWVKRSSDFELSNVITKKSRPSTEFASTSNTKKPITLVDYDSDSSN